MVGTLPLLLTGLMVTMAAHIIAEIAPIAAGGSACIASRAAFAASAGGQNCRVTAAGPRAAGDDAQHCV